MPKLTYAILLLMLSFSTSAFAEQPTFPSEIDKIKDAIDSIKKVDANGEGHIEAVKAMKVLNALSADNIPLLLEGMDNANKLSLNWIRSAVVSIASKSDKLPTDAIRAYFDDRTRAHMGRLLAFDLLTDNDEKLKNDLVPTLSDDPSLPLRYKGVEYLIAESEKAESMESLGLLGSALDKSRDIDQIITIAKLLKERGVSIDLQDQLGFLSSWKLAGIFDNKDEKGFDIEYGPEKSLSKIDTDATYEDATETLAWMNHNTIEPTGLVDLNDVIGKKKGVIVYALATYDCDQEQTADVRIGCINAHKVWVNGELVMSNEIYHNGISPDKFTGVANLKKGKNEVLIKVCQNEQTQPWAQRWQFQLRICDSTGKTLEPENKKEESDG
ncbi:MAG: hypothetical protein AAGA30_04595 [Planctomycetota bacterium]